MHVPESLDVTTKNINVLRPTSEGNVHIRHVWNGRCYVTTNSKILTLNESSILEWKDVKNVIRQRSSPFQLSETFRRKRMHSKASEYTAPPNNNDSALRNLLHGHMYSPPLYKIFSHEYRQKLRETAFSSGQYVPWKQNVRILVEHVLTRFRITKTSTIIPPLCFALFAVSMNVVDKFSERCWARCRIFSIERRFLWRKSSY